MSRRGIGSTEGEELQILRSIDSRLKEAVKFLEIIEDGQEIANTLLVDIRDALSVPPEPGSTRATSLKGQISMAQTTYMAVVGPDTITLTTLDQNGTDITAQCTYSASSTGSAVQVNPSAGNLISVTNSAGTDTLTIVTSDAGFAVPDLVLATTVSAPTPVPGTTTAVSKTGVIS